MTILYLDYGWFKADGDPGLPVSDAQKALFPAEFLSGAITIDATIGLEVAIGGSHYYNVTLGTAVDYGTLDGHLTQEHPYYGAGYWLLGFTINSSVPDGYNSGWGDAGIDVQFSSYILTQSKATFLEKTGFFIKSIFSLNTQVINRNKADFVLKQVLTEQAKNEFLLKQALLDKEIAKAVFLERHQAGIAASTIVQSPSLIATANGKAYDLIEFDLSGDWNSFSYTWSATLKSIDDYNELNPGQSYIDFNVTVKDKTYALIIESASLSRSFGQETFKISGRGKNALLDHRYNDKQNLSYAKTNAQTIINNLSNAAGVDFSSNCDDWQIKKYDANSIVKIDVIQKLAEAVGAIIQPTPSGGLAMLLRYKQKPSAITSFDFQFDEDCLLSLSESYDDRPGYDYVEVGNEDISENANASIDWNAETNLLNVSIVPFQNITIDHSLADNDLKFFYQGIVFETITAEEVAVIDGTGNLSKPFYNLVSSEYLTDDLGALTIQEDGKITTATTGNSLLSVTYKTKYHQYRASKSVEQSRVLVWAE